MTVHKITAQEMHRHDTGNDQIIRTKVPRDQIDDRGLLILQRLRGSGLSAGDHLLVQCMNEDGSELLHEADFAVTSVKVQMKQVFDDNGGERMAQETTFRLARRTEWWSPPGAAAAPAAQKATKAA